MNSAQGLDFDCQFKYPSGFALDFAFSAGEGITALVGPSGVGKTTVLNLIAGLIRPNTGRIALRGQMLFDSKSSIDLPPEIRGVGYVFQDYQLFPHLTVHENLRYGETRLPAAQVDLQKTVDALELANLLPRYPATLSGGQKQRVALGRAILRGPRLLLLDEPLNAVHWQLTETVLEFLRWISEELHIPTILVSHDEHMAAKIAKSQVSLACPS